MTNPQGPVVVAEMPTQPFQRLDATGPAVVSDMEALTLVQKPSWDRYLVVSPYHEQEHLLDLESVELESQLLALSLINMQCLREDYATAPYTETFNWGEIIETLHTLARGINHRWKETSFFLVAFRSRIPPTTVYAELGTLDRAAHAEATASGGFLKYAQSHLGPALARCTKLTLAPGTGLGLPMKRAGTWPHASGDHRTTQRKEAWAPLTAGRRVLPGPCIPSGKSTVSG